MRRPAKHRRALVGRRIAGAEPRADFQDRAGSFIATPRGRGQAMRRLANTDQRIFQVDPDVVGERLERRDVKHRDAVAKLAALRVAKEAIDRPHKRGQRLAASGRRTEQHVMAWGRIASGDRRPPQRLRGRGSCKPLSEPGANRRMKGIEH